MFQTDVKAKCLTFLFCTRMRDYNLGYPDVSCGFRESVHETDVYCPSNIAL
jgi:hypothetical protein